MLYTLIGQLYLFKIINRKNIYFIIQETLNIFL
jgi:hypothetical protein